MRSVFEVTMRAPHFVFFCLVSSAAFALEPKVQVKDVAIAGQRYSVVAVVEGPLLPVTITLERGAAYENCAPSTPLPLRRVVSKAGDTVLLEVGQATAGQKWRCAYQFKTALGDLDRAAPEDCSATLPFRPTGAYRVIQGFDGALTHKDRVRHALDFAMPEGTPVLAARAGVVTWIQDDAQDGTRAGGNTVSLLHGDGTLTQYAHLKRGSVLVREGQTISRGSVLAQSGSTNDVPVAPHLHFEVFVSPGPERKTLPFTLSLPGGACRAPKEGEEL
ncbi:MAG: M23 family metallopeptidase [Archangium sp.]|nr:M23 family metallopeptidase [Archangium sp.]